MIRIYAKDYSLQDVHTLQHVLAVAYRECPNDDKNPVTRDIGRAFAFSCELAQALSNLLGESGKGGGLYD